jgi:glycosyltransferase involved in cell wall biosynthesis
VGSIETAIVPPDTDPETLSLPTGPIGTADKRRSVHEAAIDDQPVPIKLSILMAAYNEERTIVRAVNCVLAVQFPCEVELIVVDDGSTDATPDLLKEFEDDPRVIIHRHAKNSGKGASIITAASLANGTHIVPFDADMEYLPEDIANMLNPVIKGRCDVVYGARLFGCNTVYQSYRYAMGNKILTQLVNVLYDAYLNDLHTCLKLMPLALLRDMTLTETGFGLDTQITALLLRKGVRPFEVPISYYSRSHEQGKKINWRDAVKCVWILLRTRVATPKRGRSLYLVNSKLRPVSARGLSVDAMRLALRPVWPPSGGLAGSMNINVWLVQHVAGPVDGVGIRMFEQIIGILIACR